jgi:hypothetical protein
MLHEEDDANIAIEIIVQWITYPILLIGREDRWPPDATNATWCIRQNRRLVSEYVGS